MFSRIFWAFIAILCRGALRLRYRITIRAEALKAKGWEKGILFLPNHTAHMDPLLLYYYFWPHYQMRPLVVEYVYRIGALQFLMKLIRAIAIPDFDTSVNQYKVFKAQQALKDVAEGLRKGENFLLFPSGRLKNTGKEILGGASGAHALVQECPDAHVVLIRFTGFWGSTFSRAFEGTKLSLGKSFVHAFKALLKNGIFFLPKRDVLVEFEPAPDDLPRDADRVAFNRYLENWYNRYPDGTGGTVDVEPLKLVSYSAFRWEVPEVHVDEKKEAAEQKEISPEVESKVYGEIRKILDRPNQELNPDMHLAADLGMDSLNLAELVVTLSHLYELGELHPEDLHTVRDVLNTAEGAKDAPPREREASSYHWPEKSEEKGRLSPVPPIGETIPEAFLRSCERMDRFSACSDDLSGVLTYRKIRQSVLVLAAHFRTLEGPYVGVLLPSSIGAYVTILAVQIAGKIPVMLNWTLGPRYIEEMVKMTDLKVIFSSWRFLEKISHVDFGNAIEKFVLLEDVRKSLSLRDKLKGAFLSRTSLHTIFRTYGIHKLSPDDPSVILFTSGTEASPKGVPLSHKNILSDLRAALQCIQVSGDDTLYGILPPFHSFGFSVTGLFPLLAGMRVAFFPDPTDGFALAEGVKRWQITMFCAAPLFLKGLFRAAKPEQLASLRFFVSGAEKASPELYQRVADLGTGAYLIEGYGLTECSPILTLTRPNLPPKGVGLPLPGVELCTIHLETSEPLPYGAEGEICARGPNIFKGYLGNPRPAFIEIDGVSWYRTGDIGYLDPEGNLILSGRLKRFTKVGGEMISLAAVEEAIVSELTRQGKISPDVPSLALSADEKNSDKAELILFSLVPLESDEVNEIIGRSGFSRLVKVSTVKQINEIPVLGTGKVDYRSLKNFME